MSDLKYQLVARHNDCYDVFRDATSMRIIPKRMIVNRQPPLYETAVKCMLKRERYQLTWSVAAENAHLVTCFELFVFLTNFQTPDLRFDLRKVPQQSIAFEMPESRYVFILLRLKAKCIVTLHTLYVNIARSCLLGSDPLMYEWDLLQVGRALRMQRQIVREINQMASLWMWDDIRTHFGRLLLLWRQAFPGTLSDTSVDANDQRAKIQCDWTYPTILATSSQSLIVHLMYEDDLWHLEIGREKVAPTFVHIQYLIWCFPDRHIKIAVQRDVLPATSGARVKLVIEGHAMPTTPAHFWMGFNMIANTPFFNLWSVPSKIDFVNANDLLVLFKQIEMHFADEAMFDESTQL